MIDKSPIAFLYAIFNVISTIYKDSYLSTFIKYYVCDEQRLKLSFKENNKRFCKFLYNVPNKKSKKKIVKKLFLVLEWYDRFYADLM